MTRTETEGSKSPADDRAGHEARAGSGVSHPGESVDTGAPSVSGMSQGKEDTDMLSVTTTTSEDGKAQEAPEVLSVSPHLDDDLPLVLVTFGNGPGEFEAMYDHLDTVEKQNPPQFQSLIVARPDVSSVVLRVLGERVRSMPTVHLRKLGKSDFSELRHETGTFFVTPDKRLERI